MTQGKADVKVPCSAQCMLRERCWEACLYGLLARGGSTQLLCGACRTQKSLEQAGLVQLLPLTHRACQQGVLHAAAPEHQIEQGLQLVATAADDHAGVAAAGGRDLNLPPTQRRVAVEQATGSSTNQGRQGSNAHSTLFTCARLQSPRRQEQRYTCRAVLCVKHWYGRARHTRQQVCQV